MEIILILFVFIFYLLMIAVAVVSSLVTSILVGIAIGAIPAMCGMMKKKSALGWIGFAACFVLYWMYGFLPAQIASIAFTFFIVKEKKAIAE